MSKFISIFLLLTLPLFSLNTFSQIGLEKYGKNRIQYEKITWKYYEQGRLRIHYYGRGGKMLARYVAEQSSSDIKAVERRMNGNFPRIMNIILYNNYDDYKQSNVGLDTDPEIVDANVSDVNFVQDKMVIYFTGKHADLKNQIRKGIANIILERSLLGSNVWSYAKSATAQKVPEWTTSGYVEYAIEGWDETAEESWKQLLRKDKRTYFNDLSLAYPALAGRAFWKYVGDKYGEQDVKNLLYSIIKKNNVNKALKEKYGIKQRFFYDSVIKHFKDRYLFEKQLTEDPNLEEALFVIEPSSTTTQISQVNVSPKGKDVAYVAWDNGVAKVHIEKTYKQKKTEKEYKATILSLGILDYTADSDPDYPILAWSNTGFKLAIVYNRNNKIYVKLYDAIKGKIKTYKIRNNRFDRIHSCTFMEDDEMLIVSAIRRGQTDIFEYRLRNGRMTQLTNDEYDDVNPQFVSGGSRHGFVFLSNRPEPFMNIKPLPNELPNGPLNAFFYNAKTKRTELLRLTNETKDVIESVIPYGPDHFTYLTSTSGIRNRRVVMFKRNSENYDTAYSVPVTNYSSNIISHQYHPASAKVAEVIRDNNLYKVYFRKVELPAPEGAAPTKLPIKIRAIDTNQLVKLDIDKDNKKATQMLLIPSGDVYQTAYPLEKEQKENATAGADTTVNYDNLIEYTDDGKRIVFVDSSYLNLRSKPYIKHFQIKDASGRVDNSLVFNRYQNYSSGMNRMQTPDLGGMLKFTLKDRMEDYKFTAAAKLQPNLTYNLLIKYENLRNRLDWDLTMFTQSQKDAVELAAVAQGAVSRYMTPLKRRLTVLQGGLSYPLSRVSSFRLKTSLRQDLGILKGANPLALVVPDINEYYSMNRLEYIHDNSRLRELNIYQGLRAKVFGEYFYKFSTTNELPDVNNEVNDETGSFYNFGFDIRYYKQLYKNITFAVRSAGAHSGGVNKIMYRLGGVDNEFFPSNNNFLQPTAANKYAFQSYATNMRGYASNIRNGNTYTVVNTEVRVPLITSFTHRPVNNLFLKHLQLVGFVDAGSAWEGFFPDFNLKRINKFYYRDPFNPTTIVTVPYEMPSGLVLGYGLGLRAYVYSYYMRIDYGFNIERKSALHVSFGFDF